MYFYTLYAKDYHSSIFYFVSGNVTIDERQMRSASTDTRQSRIPSIVFPASFSRHALVMSFSSAVVDIHTRAAQYWAFLLPKEKDFAGRVFLKRFFITPDCDTNSEDRLKEQHHMVDAATVPCTYLYLIALWLICMQSFASKVEKSTVIWKSILPWVDKVFRETYLSCGSGWPVNNLDRVSNVKAALKQITLLWRGLKAWAFYNMECSVLGSN